jgi:hypothetical protein
MKIATRAAYGKAPNVAAGEKLRGDHKAVGGIRQPLSVLRQRQVRRIVAFEQLIRPIRFVKHLVDDALHHRAARAMPEQYRLVHGLSLPLGVVLEVVGSGDRYELARFNATHAQQDVRNVAHFASFAAQHDNLQAVVVIDMHVHGRDDAAEVGVLDVV